MKWRVPSQEVDKENLARNGGKDCQACKLNRRMPWIVIDEGSR